VAKNKRFGAKNTVNKLNAEHVVLLLSRLKRYIELLRMQEKVVRFIFVPSDHLLIQWFACVPDHDEDVSYRNHLGPDERIPLFQS